jgi:hypothetical protein
MRLAWTPLSFVPLPLLCPERRGSKSEEEEEEANKKQSVKLFEGFFFWVVN